MLNAELAIAQKTFMRGAHTAEMNMVADARLLRPLSLPTSPFLAGVWGPQAPEKNPFLFLRRGEAPPSLPAGKTTTVG